MESVSELEWGGEGMQGLCKLEPVLMADLTGFPALSSIYVEPPVASAKRLCASDAYQHQHPFYHLNSMAPMCHGICP